MESFEDAIKSMRHNDAHFWWLTSGSNKKGQNVTEEDINASVDLLRTAVGFLPPGDYRLECVDRLTNRAGSYKFTFNKPKSSGQDSQPQMTGNSANPGGLSNEELSKLKEEIRFRLMVEGVIDDVKDFLKVWPDYKKKIDTLWNEDADDDGIPDILEGAKKVSDIAQTAKQMRSIFD